MINICEECFKTPCHPQCPNAPPPKVIKTCLECGQEFITEDEYFQTEYGDFCDYHCFGDYLLHEKLAKYITIEK